MCMINNNVDIYTLGHTIPAALSGVSQLIQEYYTVL
jgi:hypothetical protein